MQKKKEFYFLKFMDTDRDDTSYINQFNYAQKNLIAINK